METELKLNVAQRDLDKVRQHALLAGLSAASPDELELADTASPFPMMGGMVNGMEAQMQGLQEVTQALGRSP